MPTVAEEGGRVRAGLRPARIHRQGALLCRAASGSWSGPTPISGAWGRTGLKRAAETAVLNANYLLSQLKGTYHLPYDRLCKHECVFSDAIQVQNDVKTLDIAKRLMDYGFHPPTIYFPLIVPGALMIEPTETESKETLDQFIAAMKEIAREAKDTPDVVRAAPHKPRLSRLDETRAARQPVLRWKPKGSASQ